MKPWFYEPHDSNFTKIAAVLMPLGFAAAAMIFFGGFIKDCKKEKSYAERVGGDEPQKTRGSR